MKFKSFIKGRKLARRMKVQGLDISIETDKGQKRHWHDPNNNEDGVTVMRYPYGYIRRTVGEDEEQVDCYIGPDENEEIVYVIHQMKKPDFKEYDEDKVMIGFSSPKEAKAAYLMHYNSPKFFGSMDEMTMDKFKDEFVTKSFDIRFCMVCGSEPGVNIDCPECMRSSGTLDTLEGVQGAIQSMYSASDQEILRMSDEIWGDGYQYEKSTPDQVRNELIGMLMDMRDLLTIQEENQYHPISEHPASSNLSPTFTSGTSPEVGKSLEENLESEVLAPV